MEKGCGDFGFSGSGSAHKFESKRVESVMRQHRGVRLPRRPSRVRPDWRANLSGPSRIRALVPPGRMPVLPAGETPGIHLATALIVAQVVICRIADLPSADLGVHRARLKVSRRAADYNSARAARICGP